MMTVNRKLKRLVTALVVVEVVVFSCWWYGVRYDILGALGTIQNWTPRLYDSFSFLPPLPATNAPSISSEPLLKVYVYDDIPPSLTINVLEPCVLSSSLRNVPKKRDNFMADVTIIRLFQTYPGRTYNPNEADLFVVPYPHKTHCICNLHINGKLPKDNHCPQVPQQDIDLLLSSLTYFNETTSQRHLFVASGDYGWNNIILESAPLLLTLGPKPETRDGNIVIPYLNNRPEYQPSILRTQDWNFTDRKFVFSYFYGDAKPRKSRPLFRQEVGQNYGSEIGGYPFVMSNLKQWTPKRQDYVYETYRQSIFCPCLPGDNARELKMSCLVKSSCCKALTLTLFAAQKRFFDVIMSGCLPVVLSYNISRVEGHKSWFRPERATVESSYPFAKGLFDEAVEIDYESFVVQVPDEVTNIKPILEAILADPAELKRRQENMAKYAPLLSYGAGEDAHKYDDAFLRIVKAIRYYLNSSDNTTSSDFGGSEGNLLLMRKSSETRPVNVNEAAPIEISAKTRPSGKISVATAFKKDGPGIDRDSRPGGPKTHPRPEFASRLLNRFVVIPERKLLFCYVEKVGCSMFNHLFRMLRLSLPEVAENATEATFQANFTWYRNTPRHHGLNKTQLEDLMVDPDWTKAVFYRDPVTRFLSAYRSKCEAGHDTTPDCIRVFGKRFASFDEALARMEQGPLPRNPHFAPASRFCGGLGATLDYYDIVHELNAETAPGHVEALLRKVGVDPETARALVDGIVRTHGAGGDQDKIVAARLGVELGVGKTQLKDHNTGANRDLCEYYSTTEKVASIMNLYREDYETFDLAPRDVNCTFRIER